MATKKRANEATRRAAVQAYLAGGATIEAVAKKYGVATPTLSSWLKQFRDKAPEPKPAEERQPWRPPAKANGAEAELASLRRETERLRLKLRALLDLVEKL